MKTKVYILGAGASKPAGAPVLKEFIGTGFFHLNQCSAFPDKSDNYTKFLTYLKERYDFDLNDPDPYKSDSFIFGYRYNIEMIISSLDEEIRNGNKDLREIRHQAIRFVYSTLENAVRDGSTNDCYPDFVNKKITNLNDEHVIITFNYETLFERALIERFRGCFSYLVDVDENKIINFPGYKKSYKNNLLVLKLHGSLNWAVCSECNKIHLFWSQKYDHIFEKRCKDCNATLKPLLIPPTIYKDLNNILKKFWNIAKVKISSANEITIIGHSLSDYDKDALELIRDSMKSNKMLPNLFIADPNNKEIYEKITLELPIGRNHFNKITLFKDFREYLNNSFTA